MLFVGCKLAFGGEMSELCKKCSAKSESNFIGRQTCFFSKNEFWKGSAIDYWFRYIQLM